MERGTRWIAVLLCALAAAAASAGALLAVERKPWEDYEILMERNMFSRARGRRAQEAARVVNQVAPNPERFVWLRGVARKNGEFIACLEDMGSGRILHLRSGDAVARGKLAEVKIDGVRYALEDEVFEVGIGSNLEATTALPPAGSTAADGAAGTSEPTGATEEVGDLLERLRQRRQRELGQ